MGTGQGEVVGGWTPLKGDIKEMRQGERAEKPSHLLDYCTVYAQNIIFFGFYFEVNANTSLYADCCLCGRLLQDNMRTLHEQWNQLDAAQKAPYETLAAADADRYRREVRSNCCRRISRRLCSRFSRLAKIIDFKYAANFAAFSCFCNEMQLL